MGILFPRITSISLRAEAMDVAELAMLLESIHMDVSDAEFKAAADFVSSQSKLGNDEVNPISMRSLYSEITVPWHQPQKLQFYGLYKQALSGENTTPRPSFFDYVGQKKWLIYKPVNFFVAHCFHILGIHGNRLKDSPKILL